MVIIYCPQSSVRFTYAVKQVFSLMPGANYEVTDNKDAFLQSKAARINYDSSYIQGAINIFPQGLLFQTAIVPVNPTIGQWQENPTLFAGEGDILFDIFSAAFWLTSRYEEYTDTTRDEHGRFAAKQSFLFKNNLLHLPLINIWADGLRRMLNTTYGLNLQPLSYSYLPTLDIDQVYYYKYRPLISSVLGAGKQLTKGNFKGLLQRILATLNLVPDPNNTFAYQRNIHEQQDISPLYFFHMGTGGKHDPIPLHTKKSVLAVINSVSSQNMAGIHPSYRSFNNEAIILAEKKRLEGIIGRTVERSRQHYLRFTLPNTYRQLIECGISHEYSMGYADSTGYRAGISSPFFWFDLERNEVTPLTVHPFAVMDVTLKNYMKLNVLTAIKEIEKLATPVKQYGGEFSSLWHNESLGSLPEWKGWSDVYEAMTSFCKTNED